MRPGTIIMTALLATGLSAAEIKFSSDWGRYQVSDRTEANVTVELAALPELPLTAQWELADLFGAPVASGQFALDGSGKPLCRTLVLALDQRGYYRLRLRLSDQRQVLHGEGSTSFASVDFDPDRGPRPDGLWAVNGHSRPDQFEFFRKLGITMSRLDIPWRDVEPEPGRWNYAVADRMVAESRLHNVKLLAILGKNPKWLKPADGRGTDHEKFLNYVRETVTRYRDSIQFWDLWNEPQYSWNGAKDEFGLLMRDAFRIIKQIQPASTVVFNGHPFEEELRNYTLDNLAPLNGEIPFDALGMHPYSRPRSPDANRFLEHMTNISTLLARIAPGRELWISELGWPTSTDALGVTELEQAAYLQRAALLGLAAGVTRFVWYMPFSGKDPVYHESQYGFLYENHTPKPALAAYAFLIRVLDRMRFERDIPLGEAMRCLKFGDGNRNVFALWATGEPVRLTAKWPETIRIRRGDGSALPADREVVEIGPLPLFLEGENMETTLETAQLTLAEPIRFDRGSAVPEGILLRLSNRSGQPLNAVLAATLPPGVTFASPRYRDANPAEFKFTVGREPKEILLKLNYPEHPFSAPIRLTLRTESTVQQAIVPLRIEHARFREPAAADCNFRKWAEVEPFRLDTIAAIAPADMQKEWRGPADLSAEAWFGWNREGILFSARVRDDRHENDFAAAKLWAADSLQLAICAAPGRVPDYYDEHTVELGVALTPAGVRRVVYSGDSGRTFAAAVLRDEATKTTSYDLVIPWQLVGLAGPPPENAMLSCNFIVNDRDANGGRKWVQLAEGIGIEKNPALFPRFQLKGISR